MASTAKNASSSHLVLALVFMLGVIVTMQQRRGNRPPSLGAKAGNHRGDAAPHEQTIASTPHNDDTNDGKQPTAAAQPSLEELLDEVRREDEAKERIPALMRRPVKRPRQSMNNLTSGKYWAQGSWGRVIASSSACWAHPAVDSFAVQCTKKLLPPVVVITVEHLANLKVLKAACASCRTARDAATPAAGAVKIVARGESAGGGGDDDAKDVGTNDESSAFVVGSPVPRARMTTATFAVEAKPACRSMEQSFRRSCVIKIDLLFRVMDPATPTEGVDAPKGKRRKAATARMGAPPPEACFITMGDWGTQQLEQTQVAETLVDVVQRRMVKFMVSTGDNFYPTGVQSLSDQQWLTVFERPYAHVALQRLRWFICAGNHDQWGLPPQKEYGLEHPRWYMPHYHYNTSIPLFRDVAKNSVDTIELAVMNTAGREMHQQLEMIDTFFSSVEERHGGYLMDLSRHWRFVVNHEPLFSGGIHGSSARGKLLRATFQPYMQQSLVHAYFNGDDHFLEIHRANGTDYFTSGAGGGSVRYFTVEAMNDTAIYQMATDNRDSVRGFMLHCIKEGLMHTTLIDGITGKILFKHKTKYFVDLSEFQME